MKSGRRANPSRSISASASRPTQRIEMPLQRRAARFAQTRGAFLHDAAIELRHARGGRAGAGAEGEGVDVRQDRTLRSATACWRSASSVSVGKPAMRSAPSAISGRAAFRRAQRSIACAREWRRFMRFRIRSSPCCSERCRWGAMRSFLRDQLEQQRIHLDRVDRGEAQLFRSGTCFRMRATRLPSAGAPGRSPPHEVRSTPVSTISGAPLATRRAHLLHHVARRRRARIAAAVGDDAEGAAVIAAVLHLHVGAGAFGEAVDQMRRGFAHAHDVGDEHALRAWREASPRASFRRCR